MPSDTTMKFWSEIQQSYFSVNSGNLAEKKMEWISVYIYENFSVYQLIASDELIQP